MNEWIKKQMEIFPPGRDWGLQVLGMEEGQDGLSLRDERREGLPQI